MRNTSTKTVFFFRSFLLFGIGLFAVLNGIPEASAQTALPQEALVNLVKPSIVRIAEHVSGTAKIPEIKVNIRERLVAAVPDTYTTVPVDEYLLGSGFVMHPEGYIATNAHVVSEQTVKQGLASDSALAALYANALFLSDAEMQSFLDTETENSFSKVVLKYVMEHSIYDLKSEVAVLRPGSEKKSLQEQLVDGYAVEVIYANDNFLEDEKDVALLKIDETALPALSFGKSSGIAVGTRVFAFGFPATAEVTENSSQEATFTGGVVSAIKQSSNRDVRLFQTDAKVSEGSSGGPLFNEYGEVVGLVTFQTSELNRSSGDNFAFALPIEIVEEAAAEMRIFPYEGTYGELFKKGFSDFSGKRCAKAKNSFQMALKTSNRAFVSEKYLDPYLKQCDELEKSGMALDTRLDEWKGGVRALGSPFFYIGGVALLLFGILGGGLYWVLRQVRREEKEIAALETRLYADEARIRGYDSLPRTGAVRMQEGGTFRKEKKIV